jgi:hypothetical protein
LASTVGGTPCAATGIDNAAAGSEIIIGWCADGDAVEQGVFWKSSTPASAPTQLQPLSLLGLLPDVKTMASVVSTTGGLIVGVSISNNGTQTPVSWSSTGAPTQLAAPLLSTNTNCVPADISDASTPAIIGNCDDSGTGGGNKAVLWTSTTAAYTVLPVPRGANTCQASNINISGQILGRCDYGTDTHRVVQWGSGGTGPAVLMTVGGGTALRTYDADMNDSGVIACNYLAGSASVGFEEPCSWNPAGGNTDAVAITPPGGSSGPATTIGIGNNGKIIGIYETAAGVVHSFHVEPGGNSATDEGSPEGGNNTIFTSLSNSGVNGAAGSEDGSEHTHAVAETIP